jgi:undecaprenyl diphosphate synthase
MPRDPADTMVTDNGSVIMKDLLEALAPGSKDLALARAIDSGRIPAHIAIIMDGNGRWAQQRNLPRAAGHKEGVPAVRSTV